MSTIFEGDGAPKPVTPEDQAIIDRMLPLFDRWDNGDLSTADLFHNTSPMDRAVAARHLVMQPSQHARIMRMLDAMIEERARRDHLVVTRFGIFTPEELRHHGGRLSHGTITFTDRSPRVAPKPARNVPF